MIAEGWVRASLVACVAAAVPPGAAPGRPAAAQDPAKSTQASTAAPAARPAPLPAPPHTLTVTVLDAAVEHLAAELRSQYMIGFVPDADAAKKDGWHGLRLKLGELRDARGKKIKAVVRARGGFYDVPPPRQR